MIDLTLAQERHNLVRMCDEHGFDVDMVISSSRKAELVDMRTLYALKNRVPLQILTVDAIGGVINRDHSNVIYLVRTAFERYRDRPHFKRLVDAEGLTQYIPEKYRGYKKKINWGGRTPREVLEIELSDVKRNLEILDVRKRDIIKELTYMRV